MAFDINKFQRWSNGVAVGCNNMWEYTKTDETMATIIAAAYFDNLIEATDSTIKVNDIMWIQASDAQQFVTITSVTAPVTVAAFSVVLGAGSVGTANLVNLAVTGAKIDNATITDGKMVANTLTSASISKDVIQYVKVAVSAAEIQGMYAAPKQLIAAQGANTIIRIHDVTAEVDYGGAQYAAGGALALQYDNTANGAGVLASAALPAATLNGFAADSVFGLAGAAAAGTAAATVNKGIFLSNLTAAFTTGSSPVDLHISYSVDTTTF